MTFDNLQKRNRWIKGGTLKALSLSALFLFSFLFLINLVSAVSPFLNPVGDKGLIIEHPIADPIKAGDLHKFHFHVTNISDGRRVNISLVTCSFHLYNSSGSHIFKNNYYVSSDDIFDFEQEIQGGNFTVAGQYAFIFQCNSSAEGGFYTHDFMVTSTTGGQDFDYWFIILGTALAILFLIFSLVTPEEFFVYISGVFFLIEGIYIMINGFSLVTNSNTRMFAFIYLGIGILFTVGAYVFNLYSNSNNEEEEEY